MLPSFKKLHDILKWEKKKGCLDDRVGGGGLSIFAPKWQEMALGEDQFQNQHETINLIYERLECYRELTNEERIRTIEYISDLLNGKPAIFDVGKTSDMVKNEDNSLVKTKRKLESEIQIIIQGKKELEKSVKQLQDKRKQLTDEGNHVSSECDELVRKKGDFAKAVESLQIILREKENEIEELNTDIDTLQGQKENQAEELDELREDMNNYKLQRKQLEDDVSKFKNQLSEQNHGATANFPQTSSDNDLPDFM
jgi:chromosome segregation ATPase